MRRDDRETTFVSRTPPDPQALAHPPLSVTAAVAAWWEGLFAFHAGAFVFNGGAWAVLGDREAGKSTFMALMAQLGADVLADDLVVVEDHQVFAGPRCLDLRPSAAYRFGGEYLGFIGNRKRWRLYLRLGVRRAPIRGFIVLEFGDQHSVQPLGRAPSSEAVRACGGCVGATEA
jgi:hypothetical protein